MAMLAASIDTPNTTSAAPAHASVAKNIKAAPTITSNTDNVRLMFFLFNMVTLNGSNEHVLSFHLRYGLLLIYLDKRALPLRQCLAPNAYL
jgi:hypothetical protein